MNIINIYARAKSRILEKLAPMLAPSRRREITNTDFTIISNNCWAGYVYRHYDLPYQTPTVGTYMFADDYIKFISDLKYYLSCELEIIKATESKHSSELTKKNQLSVPIGKIGDIEIVFLHYSSPQEAIKKWNRRVSRVNWNNIIIKFSQMNNCSVEHLEKYDEIVKSKRVMFVSQPNMNYESAIYFKGYEKENQIYNDTLYWNKYINIKELINSPITEYK